jgi:glycosyltransferase involved in cell wall biosynthesis
MRKMQILIRDTFRATGTTGGGGLVPVFLADALASIVERVEVHTPEPELYPTCEVRRVDSIFSSSRLKTGARWLRQLLRPPLEPRQFDAVIFGSQAEPLIRTPHAKRVMVVHDLICLLFPKEYSKMHLYYRHYLPGVLRGVDKIVAVSGHTKADIQKHYGLPASKIQVIHNGFNFMAAASGSSEGRAPREKWGRYILYVGSQLPHKNLLRLIQAFSTIQSKHRVKLLLVGSVDARYMDLYRSTAAAGKVQDNVQFLGAVPHQELADILRHAELMAFPSLYEGFGMPPLEAMAAGVPVAASRAASIPEVCGDAALYFDPLDPADMARAMDTLLSDESMRRQLAEKGFCQAKKFSWERAAQEFVELIGAL